jgi:hypothetical protein
MNAKQAKLMFLLLIVLVTLLFFVHVPNGGFQSKNGPTTPTNKLQLLVVSLLLLVAGWRNSESLLTVASSSWPRHSAAPLHALFTLTSNTSLRC